MSVSLQEVIEAGGYDLTTVQDSIWLLSKQSEFEELINEANFIFDQEQEKRDLAAEVDYESHFPREREA